MPAQAQHLEFAPPETAGTGRAFTAALIVHGLLVVALTAGIQWKTDDYSVEAELWSAVPMAAAPKLVEVEPPPPPPPEPSPQPVEKAEPPAPNRDADIALAKKQKQLDEEKKLQEFREAERRKEEIKKEAEKKAKQKIEDDRKEKERKEKELKDKERAEKERKEKEAKKPVEKTESKVSPDEAKKLEAIRRENMKRIAGMAGATGDANATGTAQRSSGPSDSYGGRVRARVKPNITFDYTGVEGNPAAEVEVRCSPDGTIVSRKIVKSSGNSAWDAAVLKAVDKTEILPRDIDGRVPSPIVIIFRPKD